MSISHMIHLYIHILIIHSWCASVTRQQTACRKIKSTSATLLRCFLFMAGEPGWPGLGTPLEAADPLPEWEQWRAERSSADRTPKPPVTTPVPVTPGACCRDTFCSSAASCFGSTPGERCPPTETSICCHVYLHRYMHACISANPCTYQPWAGYGAPGLVDAQGQTAY